MRKPWENEGKLVRPVKLPKLTKAEIRSLRLALAPSGK